MQLSPVLSTALDRIGAVQTDEMVRSFLPDPDASAEAPAMPADAVNYAICYVQRSGSTLLTSLLQNSGVAGKPADFFNAGYRDMRLEGQQVFERTAAHSIAQAAEEYGCRSVAEYLNVVSGLTRSPNGVFGCKLDLCHASILMRRGLFWNPHWNWKYVYVTREDLLGQSISYYTAQETGLWSSISEVRGTVSFDEAAIFERMRYLAEVMGLWECVFAALGIQPLRLTYEQIESDPKRAVSQCLHFLGVPFDATRLNSESIYRKQRTAQAEDWAERIRASQQGRGANTVAR